MLNSDLVYETTLFVALTVLLILYVSLESARAIKRSRYNALVMPPVLASVITFVLGYGISNLVLLDKSADLPFVPYFYSQSSLRWLIIAQLYALIAAFAMWRGYYLKIWAVNASHWGKKLNASGYIRQRLHLNWFFIWLCVGLAVASRLLQISLGVYGYSSDIPRLYELAAYRQYMDLFAGLGLASLLCLSLTYFSARSRKSGFLLGSLLCVLFLEVFLGLMSGFKGLTILPIIIVGLGYYVGQQKLPKAWMVVAMLALFIAYQIVEPFRELRYDRYSFDNRSSLAIASAVSGLAFSDARFNQEFGVEKFLLRSNNTLWSAVSIAYNDTVGLDEGAPQFLSRFMLSPIFAYIPRLIWPTKPYSNIGYWYNVKVMGAPTTTRSSTGMSPIGYLYFGGGGALVFMGFFTIGMAQRLIFEVFANSGGGGWVVFFGVLQTLVIIDSDVGAIFTNLFRTIPLLILVQLLLFKPQAHRKRIA
jgi:hypothetical protein